MMRSMLARHSTLTAFVVAGLLVLVGLVIVSPLGLAEISHFRSDWPQLSNIGQTYGAISAVLSGLALGGVIASLLYQARDSRTAHEQMNRTFQFDLIKLELENPSFISALGGPWGLDIPADEESLREFLYVQMWVSYWSSSYATGGMTQPVARGLAADELFRSRAGRIYWSAAGRRQLFSGKGRHRQFYRILDEEYKKVPSPIIEADKMHVRTNSKPIDEVASGIDGELVRRSSLVLFGVLIGVLVKYVWRALK